MKIILSDYQNSSIIKIKGSKLIIYDKEYEVDLDGIFLDVSNAAIWLFNDTHYVLEKNGNDGELYTSKEREDKFEITKDVQINRFHAMFKINPDEIPDYSGIPKDQLRLFRNLIFARNGFVFQSADLRDYFNSCSWYKQNPDFKESDLRKDEKDFISLMKKYEAK